MDTDMIQLVIDIVNTGGVIAVLIIVLSLQYKDNISEVARRVQITDEYIAYLKGHIERLMNIVFDRTPNN